MIPEPLEAKTAAPILRKFQAVRARAGVQGLFLETLSMPADQT